MNVIEVRDLRKTYRTPFRLKKVEAVKGISFSVEKGEVFGFLGPNGAGKTTSIRILMGLIKASGGSAALFGKPLPSRQARQRVGFLPESPYFYSFLSVRELLRFTGRLFNLDRKLIAKRSEELIDRVRLRRAADQALKSYSKGMLQRAGVAQALMNDPDLVVLDEPMGGLDPVGRKEVRDIILSLRKQGKTVFFSSHILADVESIADRVAILNAGEMREMGSLSDLVFDRLLGTDVTVRVAQGNAVARAELDAAGTSIRSHDDALTIRLPPEASINEFLSRAIELGGSVMAVIPHHETLEDVFLRETDDRAAPATTRAAEEEE